VAVFGTQTADDRVVASLIRIDGPDTAATRSSVQDKASSDRARTTQLVDIVGTVASLDTVRESFRLRTRQGLRTIEAFDETHWSLDSGRHAAFRDLRVGDDARVRGEERGGRVVADEVTLLGPPLGWSHSMAAAAEPTREGEALVVGTVHEPTYELSRRIKVRAPKGDLTVEVDESVPIYKYDDRISVHELEKGDHVRVVGTWDGPDRLRARRIAVEVNPPAEQATRGYRSELPATPMPIITAEGTLVSYDEPRNRLRISTLTGDRIVVAAGTPAYDKEKRIARADLRHGDHVRAVGYWNGREILATKVEVVN
jgi:hypothetical protein